MRILGVLLQVTLLACLLSNRDLAGRAHAQGAGFRSEPRASATTAPESVEAVLASGIDTPVPASHFAHASAAEVAALIAAYERVSAPRHVRLRALSALAAAERPEAHAYLQKLVAAASPAGAHAGATSATDPLHPARSSTVLRRALVGLARDARGVRAAEITASLAHRDAEVRHAAVQVLSALGSPEALDMLAARARVEPNVGVRDRLVVLLAGGNARSDAPALKRDAGGDSSEQTKPDVARAGNRALRPTSRSVRP